MTAIQETPAPPAGPLYAGYWDTTNQYRVRRPNGTRDWQLIYTEAGHGLFRFEGGQYLTNPGDVLLYQPGIPHDYTQPDPHGRWKRIWVHWVPRPEIIDWLAWPELSPGLRHLHLPPELQEPVLKELILVDASIHSHAPRHEALAANALERALLFCVRANLREGNPLWNPRIQQAADYLAEHLHQKHLLETVAQRFGFSRARFADLFRQQTGQPIGQYLETRRLTQARQLIIYTNQTLTQIADRTGFSSPFYLSQRFKKHYGYSPKTLRNQRPVQESAAPLPDA